MYYDRINLEKLTKTTKILTEDRFEDSNSEYKERHSVPHWSSLLKHFGQLKLDNVNNFT